MNKLDTSIAVPEESQLTDLLALECLSISFGYQVLASISTEVEVRSLGSVKVLEASPVGPRFLILIRGDNRSLNLIHEVARNLASGDASSQLIDSEHVANASGSLLNAFYSLEKHRLDHELIVLESHTVSGCLSAVHELLSQGGVSVMEIRVLRSSTGGAYAFLTGSAQQCQVATEKFSGEPADPDRQLRIERVSATTSLIRRNFSLSGEV